MAHLDLDWILCDRKQDVTGLDEPELLVNGIVVFERQMEKGQKRIFDYQLDFSSSCVVELRERNGNRTSAIGPPEHIWASEAGGGEVGLSRINDIAFMPRPERLRSGPGAHRRCRAGRVALRRR